MRHNDAQSRDRLIIVMPKCKKVSRSSQRGVRGKQKKHTILKFKLQIPTV